MQVWSRPPGWIASSIHTALEPGLFEPRPGPSWGGGGIVTLCQFHKHGGAEGGTPPALIHGSTNHRQTVVFRRALHQVDQAAGRTSENRPGTNRTGFRQIPLTAAYSNTRPLRKPRFAGRDYHLGRVTCTTNES